MSGIKEKVPEATRTHHLLRFERVSCLQAFGVANAEKHRTAIKSESDEGTKQTKAQKVEEMKNHQVRLSKWIVNHDPETYAYENYEKARKHIEDGTPFENSNTPPGMIYRPWTVDGLLEAHRKGEPTVLDGDWD